VRPPGCNDTLIGTGDCVTVLNVDNGLGCELHKVLVGFNSNDTNTTCYMVSDIEENWNPECAGTTLKNGPSFFDRLDGSTNLSERYVNQSIEYFNNSLIGLESFIDLPMMAYMREIGYKVKVNDTYTWADYLYWANKTGCDATAYCGGGNYSVKLDCVHAYRYGMPTGCSTGIMLPDCGDEVCSVAESYRTCPKSAYYPDGDCSCPAGCIQRATLNVCTNDNSGTCASGTLNVVFNLSTYDCMNALANSTSPPIINATWSLGLLTSGVKSPMTYVSKGFYKYETGCLDETYFIKATTVDNSSGCLPVVKYVPPTVINTIGPC
jgi:hypothetical protein